MLGESLARLWCKSYDCGKRTKHAGADSNPDTLSLGAGFFPEAALPSRRLPLRRNRESRQIAEERVAEGQCVRAPPDRPRDLPGGPGFLSPERLQGKMPKIHRISRCPGPFRPRPLRVVSKVPGAPLRERPLLAGPRRREFAPPPAAPERLPFAGRSAQKVEGGDG